MPDKPPQLSGNAVAKSEDARSRRTRQALVEAYGELVLSGHQGPIRVADIVERAAVGRSTFYEHYDNTDALRMEAIAQPLQSLSDAISGDGGRAGLVALLDHFRDHRQHALEALDGRQRRLAVRVVTGQVSDSLGPANPESLALDIQQVVEGALALIHAWLRGEVRNAPEDLASAILRSAQAILPVRGPRV